MTESTGGANRGRSGVVGPGVGQLGGDDDRCTGAGRDLGHRLGVAPVLTLVEVDYAFEPVLREERTAAHHGRGVRLDADAQEHDGIDPGVAGDQLQDLGHGVAGLAPGHVDGVGATPTGRQLGVYRPPKIGGQIDRLEAGAGHGIDCGHAPSAHRGDDHDPVSGGQWLSGERRRDLEPLFHVASPRQTGLASHPREDGVVGGHGAGVAGRGPRPHGRGTALHDDDRLALRQRPKALEHRPPVVDRLHT